MKGVSFWIFFGFGVFTVAAAGTGAIFAFRNQGATSKTLGFLILFMGASLAGMLASLLFIRTKEKKP